MRRWLRRLAVPIGLAALLGAGLLAWRTLTSPRGATWVARQVLDRIAPALGAPMTIAGVEVDDDEIVLHDLRIGRGGRLLRVRTARARIDFDGLLRRNIHARTLDVDGVRFRPDGWPSTDPTAPSSPLPPIRVDALTVRRGRIFAPGAAGSWLASLHAAARVDHENDRWRIDLDRLAGVVPVQGDLPLRAAGALVVDATGPVFDATAFAVEAGASRAVFDGRFATTVPLALDVGALHLEPAELDRIDPALAFRTPLDGTLHVAGAWPKPQIAADLRVAGGGRIAAGARLDLARGFGLSGTARFRNLDPAACWNDAPAARLAGTVALALRHHADGWRLAHRLALAPSRLGDVHLVGLRSRGDGSLRTQRLHLAIATPQGRAHADTRLRLAPTVRGKGAAIVRLSEIAGRRLPLRIHLTAGGGLDAPLHARATVEPTTVLGVPITAATATARWANGVARLDDLTIATARSRLAAQGLIDPTGDRTAVDVGGQIELPDVGTALGRGARGAATVSGHLRGAWPPAADLQLTLPSGTVDGVSVTRLAAAATLANGGRRGSATATADMVVAAGLTPTSLRTRLAWEPNGAATVVRLDELSLPPWALAAPATLRRDGETTLDRLALRDGRGGTVEVAGRLAAPRGIDLTARAAGLALQPLCRLRSTLDCRGRVDAAAHVGGTWAAPALDGDLTATDIAVDQVTYGTLGIHARTSGNRIALDANLRHPTAGVLSLAGTVPGWSAPAGAPLDLQLHASDLAPSALAALFPTQLRHVGGRVGADLTVRGSWRAPALGGELSLDGGTIGLAANGVDYQHVTLRLGGDGSDLVLREFSAATEQGELHGSGRFHLGADGVQLDVALTLRDVEVARRPAVGAAATGDVRLGGTLTAPEVTGTIELTDAVVRPSLLPMTRTDLQPDPTIHVIDSRPRPSNTVEAPAVGPPAPVVLDLAVRLGDDCWIKRADAAIALGGTIRIRKALTEAPRFTGRIFFQRGWYTFQSTRFYIEGGSLTFPDVEPQVTVLDVTASHRTPEYTVTVKVGGSIDQPTLTMFSDPPLPEADVLALLLFGKPTQQLGANETGALQQQAVALAAGYAVPGLKASVMDALGIDTLDVEMGSSTGTTQPGQVRIGRYVAEDVFVSLAQEFGAGVAQVFGVEYALSRRVSIKASASTTGQGAIDLYWHRRY